MAQITVAESSVARRRSKWLMRCIGTTVLLAATPAVAGPPFFSDDPEPTDPSHWEIYGYLAGTHVAGGTSGESGFDINYGGARDLQLTAVVPLDYQHQHGTDIALGDLELAAKLRFLHQRTGSAMPDVAFFPRVFTPTGGRRFGTGHAQVLLPVWAGKDFGPWSVFGGGGYEINPGAGNRSFWLSGVGVTRTLTKRLSVGVEAYHHTADATDGAAFTGVNLGALYKLSDHWSLIGSGGPGVQNADREGRYAFYAALKADY